MCDFAASLSYQPKTSRRGRNQLNLTLGTKYTTGLIEWFLFQVKSNNLLDFFSVPELFDNV